jgi:hypothetical protein
MMALLLSQLVRSTEAPLQPGVALVLREQLWVAVDLIEKFGDVVLTHRGSWRYRHLPLSQK